MLAALLAVGGVAWLVTGDRMGVMESMPGMGLGGLGFYVTVWVVMMAAMMFPAVAPAVLADDHLRDDHPAGGKGAPADATALFVCGYLLVWTAAGLVAYALFELLRSLDPAFLAWDEAGRFVTAGVIVAAVAYQLTPVKRACLFNCRSPRTFLAKRWRERAVNECLLWDGCETVALLGGMAGEPSSQAVRLWLEFGARPTARNWYRAHNAGIVGAYLEHRGLAEPRAHRSASS